MHPVVLNGKELAAKIAKDIAGVVEGFRIAGKRAPGLGVILVGDNPASHTYVANKEKYARSVGFETFNTKLPADASEAQVLKAVDDFNRNARVDGILVQLPLPSHIDSNKILNNIDPAKDADGLHPLNQGLMLQGQGQLRPCTPLGSMRLLEEALPERKDLSGLKAVVIGRSILVGKPLAMLLLEKNATVTLAHSKSPDLPAICREADILVAAVGKPLFVKKEWVKQGAVVIDVGINRLDTGKLAGDVDYEDVAPRCAAITPVPGGVGPMTICMLIMNTLNAYKTNEKLT